MATDLFGMWAVKKRLKLLNFAVAGATGARRCNARGIWRPTTRSTTMEKEINVIVKTAGDKSCARKANGEEFLG